MWKRRLRHSF